MRIVVAALASLLLVTGCSHIPGMGSKAAASPSAQATAAGTPLAKAGGVLDAEVAMPSSFPSDVPIYPKARLTAGAEFVSTGQVAWGMEWEVAEATPKVIEYYRKQLTTGDWTLNVTNTGDYLLAGTITRTNSNEKGVINIAADGPITMISLSLSSTS